MNSYPRAARPNPAECPHASSSRRVTRVAYPAHGPAPPSSGLKEFLGFDGVSMYLVPGPFPHDQPLLLRLERGEKLLQFLQAEAVRRRVVYGYYSIATQQSVVPNTHREFDCILERRAVQAFVHDHRGLCC